MPRSVFSSTASRLTVIRIFHGDDLPVLGIFGEIDNLVKGEVFLPSIGKDNGEIHPDPAGDSGGAVLPELIHLQVVVPFLFVFVQPYSFKLGVEHLPVRAGGMGIDPVSYTHLDVYKRQVVVSSCREMLG